MIEGLNHPEAVLKHFKNSLLYIQGRKLGRGNVPEFAVAAAAVTTDVAGGGGAGGEMEQIQRLYRDVEVQGVLLKLGVNVE